VELSLATRPFDCFWCVERRKRMNGTINFVTGFVLAFVTVNTKILLYGLIYPNFNEPKEN
jgi:hypothetical protein